MYFANLSINMAINIWLFTALAFVGAVFLRWVMYHLCRLLAVAPIELLCFYVCLVSFLDTLLTLESSIYFCRTDQRVSVHALC